MEILTEQSAYELAGNELWPILLLVLIIALSFFAGKLSKFFLSRVSP